MNTWIVIPAYNEEKYISKVLSDVIKLKYKVLVVDDGSKDNTLSIARKTGIECLTYKNNKGKGYAARKGCDYAVSQGAEQIVLMDSDGQHLAKDVKKLLDKLKTADIVFGQRKKRKQMPVILRVGNFGLNTISRIITGMKIEDTQSGFRAFKTSAYKKIRWKSNNYSMESEMIIRASKHKLKYETADISTIYLDSKKGTTVKDGIKIFGDMIKWKIKK